MKDVYSFEILKIVKCSLEHRVSSISFLLQLKFISSLELVFILVFFLVNRILSWISPSLLSVEDDSLFWEFVDRLCSEKNTVQLISNKEMSSRILYLSINFFDRDSIFFQSLIRWNLWMHIDGLQPIAMGHSSWLVHNNAINWAKHEPTRPSKFCESYLVNPTSEAQDNFSQVDLYIRSFSPYLLLIRYWTLNIALLQIFTCLNSDLVDPIWLKHRSAFGE